MKYLLLLMLIMGIKDVGGQSVNRLNSVFEKFAEKEENPCDSVVSIYKYGNINYKLIFIQSGTDIHNKNMIVIPHSKICTSDRSIILSDEPGMSKTILQLGYDTCIVREFTKDDGKRVFEDIAVPPDTADIEDWKINIEFQQNRCMDTDYNKVRVEKDKDDYIDFSCLYNIQVCEMDLDHDHSPEIYLISYIWCKSAIRIYRIDMK